MPVCLISTRFWQRRFSEDRGVVGRTLYVDSTPTAIIGVLPGNLVFPDTESDLWIALRFAPKHQTQRSLDVYGRLRPGVSAGNAQAWLNEATARAESEMPEWLRTRRVTVTPIRAQMISDERRLLLLLSGIGFCVLLICCANMSNLLLARHLNREREMALRASVGATAARLVRQLLTEAMLLCAAGTTAGFITGRLLVPLSYGFLSDSRFKALIATGDDLVDARVAAFAIFLSLLTTVLFGLAPSLRFTRMDLNEALKASPRRRSLSRGESITSRHLIAMELAIAFVLLTGAGLLVQSFGGLLWMDRGYTVDHLLTARLPIPTAATLAGRKQFFHQLIKELEAMPDVRAVGVVTGLPLGGLNATMTFKGPVNSWTLRICPGRV
jgi:predicted permease